jgi:adenylate cyclase
MAPLVILRQLVPAATALGLLLIARQSGLAERLNLAAYDLALQLRPAPSGATTPVRIIGIDEQDLARYGPQVSDGLLADAVERLDRLGVKAIGLDMFCAQPVGPGWRRLRQLAATNPRLVSIYFALDGKTAIPGTPLQRQAAADLYSDPQDGVLRRDLLFVSQGPQAGEVSLPMRLLQIAGGHQHQLQTLQRQAARQASLGVGAGGYLPTSGVAAPAYLQRMLPFHKPGSFPTWPLRSLLAGPVSQDQIRQLQGSIVLIGVVAPSSKDQFAVPFSSWRPGQRRYQLPGVEIHAHRLAGLLASAAGEWQGVQAVPRSINALLLLLGCAAGLAVGEGVVNLRRGFLLMVAGLLLGGAAIAVALTMGFWGDAALPLFGFALIAAAGLVRRGGNQQIRGIELEHQNQQSRTLFERFLSHPVAEVLLDTPQPQDLDQQLRPVTVLISDLRGFSLISADLEPALLMQMLNNYLALMFEVIEAYGGTIDEVLGDAILVLFGAPTPRADHREAAIACAIQMQQMMVQVNASNRQHDLPELAMGIGLCSGDVMAGTIGSQRRAKYGVVGTAVNLAARIEALTVGGEVYAAASTITGLQAQLSLTAAHRLPLKGSESPLDVYAITAITAPYNLALPSQADATPHATPLAQPVPIQYCLMHGKSWQEPFRIAALTHLAEREAWLSMPGRQPDAFANLVLRVPNIAGEAYAKVRGSDPRGVRIVWTSMPAAIRAWMVCLGSAPSPGSQP